MDLIGVFSYLRQFNADVLLFGAAAWGITLLLKKTLLKKAGEKLLALLPFLLGAVLYTAYRLVLFGVCDAAAESALGEGLTCGAFAAAVQVVVSRLTGKEQTVSVKAACVQSILAGYPLSAQQAEELAATVGQDEQKAKELLAVYVGDAADTYYPLLRRTLELFDGKQ